MEPNEIYAKALERWGFLQVIMAFEEMAELQKELSKWLRHKGSIDKITEEIADAQIMLDQMTLKFGPALVARKKAEKLARLEEILRCP